MADDVVVLGKFDYERKTKNYFVFHREGEPQQYVPKEAFKDGAPASILLFVKPEGKAPKDA